MSTTRARRPRGPILDWRPNENTRALIADVLAILDEYRDYWPLSVRAVYYRLLGSGRYAYGAGLAGRVSEHVSNARRAGEIPWEAISDSGAERLAPGWWSGEREWLEDARSWAEDFRLDRQADRPQRLLVWCEAKGMAPMLASAADEYGIEVLSGSGYDSTTIRHEVGISTWALHVSSHSLRHTYTSHLIAGLELDAVTASKLAGHANPQVTMSVYADDFRRASERNAAVLARAAERGFGS